MATPSPPIPETPAAVGSRVGTRASVPYLVGGILVSSLWAFALGRGDPAAFLGSLVGKMIWPTLIAFAVRGRKRDWSGFSRWFFWLALLLPPVFRVLWSSNR